MVVTNPFFSHCTSAALRILADQIDNDSCPDYVFLISNDGEYCSTHSADNDIHGLIGALRVRGSIMISEVE